MSMRIEETINSRALHDSGNIVNQRSIELEFIIWEDNPAADLNPVLVRALVLATVQAAPYGDPLYGLWLNDIKLDDQLLRTVQMARVTYGVAEPQQLNLLTWGLTTAGSSEQITHSLSTIANYGSSTEPVPPSFNQAINVVDGKPQGTTRMIPQMKFWVTAMFSPATWDASQWLTILDIGYTWNQSAWHGWPAKYVMFEHAEAPEVTTGAATAGSPKLVPVKFYFNARRPDTVDPGNGVTFPRDPHDFVWFNSQPLADTANSAISTYVRSSHKELLYAGSDFTLLGLGS